MAKKTVIVSTDLSEGLQREINLFCRGIIPMTKGSTMMVSEYSKQEILKTILTFCLKAQQSKRHDLVRYLNKLSLTPKYKQHKVVVRALASEIENQTENWELEK